LTPPAANAKNRTGKAKTKKQISNSDLRLTNTSNNNATITMKRFLTALVLSATFLLGTGCVEEPTADAPWLTLSPGLEQRITTTSPTRRVTDAGITHVTFAIKNPGIVKQVLEYRVNWKDAKGEVVDTLTGTWTTVLVEAGDTQTVTFVGPGKSAVSPQVYLREYKAD
jgi:uncharacterized protein YcfL